MIWFVAPSWDTGAMLHGSVLDRKVHYWLSYYNGHRINSVDIDDHKDVAARVVTSGRIRQQLIAAFA